MVLIALFTDVASHPGGHCAVQDTAIKLIRGSMIMKSAQVLGQQILCG
jgi:hypothetical protein